MTDGREGADGREAPATRGSTCVLLNGADDDGYGRTPGGDDGIVVMAVAGLFDGGAIVDVRTSQTSVSIQGI